MNQENILRARNLEKDTHVLRAEIIALYRQLDKEHGLNAASLPIKFDNDEDALGAYVPATDEEGAHFRFSLLFIGYCISHQIPKEDRIDLYKHEYAHFMTRYVPIPKEYTWQAGPHGSAWKYCCSLIGAVPSPYYKFGESRKPQNYEKVLTNKINDKTVPLRDRYQREKEYRAQKNRKISFQVGEQIKHPKFGIGEIVEVTQKTDSVTLSIDFGGEVKQIDQAWLLKTKYTKISER